MNLVGIWLGSMVLSACAENSKLSDSFTEYQKKPENPINELKNFPESENSNADDKLHSLDQSQYQTELSQNNSSNYLEKSEIERENHDSKNSSLNDERLTINKSSETSTDTSSTIPNNDNPLKNEIKNHNLIEKRGSDSKQNNKMVDVNSSGFSGSRPDVSSKENNAKLQLGENPNNIQPTDEQKQKAKDLLNLLGVKFYFSNQIERIGENFSTNLDILSQTAYFNQTDLIEQLKQLVVVSQEINLNQYEIEQISSIISIKQIEKLVQENLETIFSNEEKNQLIKILEEIFVESKTLLNGLSSFSEEENKNSLTEVQNELKAKVTDLVFNHENIENFNLNAILLLVNNYLSKINEVNQNLENLKNVVIRLDNKTIQLENFIISNNKISEENSTKKDFYEKLTRLKNILKINILNRPISDILNFPNPFSSAKNYDYEDSIINFKLYKIDEFIKKQNQILQKFLSDMKILIYNKSLLDHNQSALDLLATNLNKKISKDTAIIKSYWNNNKNKIEYLLNANTVESELNAVLVTIAQIFSDYQTSTLMIDSSKSNQKPENLNNYLNIFHQIWSKIKNILFIRDKNNHVSFPIIKNAHELSQKIMGTESYEQFLEIFGRSIELIFDISQILEMFSNSSYSDATISLKDIINKIITMNNSLMPNSSENNQINFQKLKQAIEKLQQISNTSLSQIPVFLQELVKIDNYSESTVLNKELALIFNNKNDL
ncbi:hypothetical protein [Mycoplasmoides fastidiosum]|nr:hypothetical protein [Mycoplasmoides fastidiosum]